MVSDCMQSDTGEVKPGEALHLFLSHQGEAHRLYLGHVRLQEIGHDSFTLLVSGRMQSDTGEVKHIV
ncbi:hypothetical protein PGT21_013547 [Puccinia graminis f. sp. tritici]|uniref:Uncharacterized protein n=1 Tax=Puccinia graminis f. sp. tritici TaxID=56615 RepID=A0A5B0M384_PUCGR|nr:hypothetical protein PGTUg99_023829 [Puccinia graminis f. sp. tritici]KAA1071597.1 hypothetical protein PGT21_012611 [Puccinia graminis f. sp. tritici]KAA1077612.1 hypothetical protein PGT21_013547 [Puccinia graminis f. sp. tritici]